ncbi:MAG: insulinase family protein [Rhabdochlamydiaceae bacterium]
MRLISKLFISTSFLFFNFCFYTPLSSNSSFKTIEDLTQYPILTPSLSLRKTAKIELSNGLKVFLISDPSIEQSAAALSVEAGSWHDPKEYPGMAHFLEHMLFMGTKAYPKEFEYMQYISDHGGMVNAATWPDHTVYMFSINNEAFENALDRFSHFFIDPLFLPSCINRELHAVDQEHAKNVENDGWREYMVFKETGHPDHPNRAFSTGNAKTLEGIPQEALKKWYKQNYSADKMHLVLFSPLTIKELLALCQKKISLIAKEEQPVSFLGGDVLSESQKGHMIFIEPVKDIKRLSLVWQLSKELAMDNTFKAPEFMAYLLKSQGSRSLITKLRDLELVEDLDVYRDRFSKETSMFRIDILLTEKGVKQIEKIIDVCFQAINSLKANQPPEKLFYEMNKLATIRYQYQSRSKPFEFVSDIANAMIYEDLSTFPEKTFIPSAYNPEMNKKVLESLTPDNCVFFVQAQPHLTGKKADQKEKWMDVNYSVVKIKKEQLLSWKSIQPTLDMSIPEENPFIPENLSILQQDEAHKNSEPKVILQNDQAVVYYSPDNYYLVPEISASFHLKSPYLDGSAHQNALLDLYLKALEEETASLNFFAQSAGLSCTFHNNRTKVSLFLKGYNDKAQELLQKMIEKGKNLTISPSQFNIYKQSLLSQYENNSKDLPLKQGIDLLTTLLFNDHPSYTDQIHALEKITYEEFNNFIAKLFSQLYYEGMIYGNLSEEKATSLFKTLAGNLNAKTFLLQDHLKRKVLKLPENGGPFLIKQKTSRQGHGVILMIQEGMFSFENLAVQQILGKALKEAFFDTLRTKQQTGYIAKASDSEEKGLLMQFFLLQSNSHEGLELLSRFELFIESFTKNLSDSISNERFDTLKDMLIKTLETPCENLSLQGNHLFNLAFEYDGDFSRVDKKIQALKELEYEKFLQIGSKYLSRDNLKRLSIIVEGLLPKEREFNYKSISTTDMAKIGTYENNR